MKKPMPNPVIPIPDQVDSACLALVREVFGVDIYFVTRAIDRLGDRFDERDITIFVLRFGLRDGESHSLRRVAKYVGLAASTVYDIDCHNFAKIRGALQEISAETSSP